MKVGIVSQARMTSTRLPGKVLMEAGGRTFLDHHLDRLAIAGVQVVVATTYNATDDPIVDLAQRRGLAHFRGSEDDVLGRFAGAARALGLDVVVRVTSDCPLIDGHIVRSGIDTWMEAGEPWLYLSNTLERTFPRGLDFEVFSAEALLDAHKYATDLAHREHVTPYLNTNAAGRVKFRSVRRMEDASDLRITLDTRHDLTVLRTLIDDHGAAELSGDQIVGILRAHPELAEINAHVEQKKLFE